MNAWRVGFMYRDRVVQYKLLEEEFDGVVLSYITSDRPGFAAQIAQDVIDIFIDQLDNIGATKRILLYLYTRGGDTAAAWNIVNLLRMYCDELVVIVPHKAHSAGTIICLGANKIIMTKQATLGPIDPSINTPLNPQVPNDASHKTLPISVEAVKGFIQFAKEELPIKSDASLAEIMLKLSECVHPLVLGQVYRSRAQIKMLASKLLQNQVNDKKKVNKIIDFLCSDSGSHDYTINRREAKSDLSLNVDKPTAKQYNIIKNIYDDISDELGFHKIFSTSIINGEYSIKRGLIESTVGGSDYFVTEGRLHKKNNGDGQLITNNEVLYEGWRHESTSSGTKEVQAITQEGEVNYEKDNEFSL